MVDFSENRSAMRKKITIFFGFVTVLFVLVGCNQTLGTPTPAPDQMIEVDSSLEQSTENLEPEDVQDFLVEESPNYCLACHIDKQQLIDTAKPEEAMESESSGEG